jgi:hypothetical protein
VAVLPWGQHSADATVADMAGPMRMCRWVWRRFINRPPTWHAGHRAWASIHNAWIFLCSLVGHGHVGVLALLAFSHPLPLALHIPLQLLCTWQMAAQNDDLCASALLNNEVSLVRWWLFIALG